MTGLPRELDPQRRLAGLLRDLGARLGIVERAVTSARSVPVGTIALQIGSPPGWVAMGQTLTGVDYPDLWEAAPSWRSGANLVLPSMSATVGTWMVRA